MRRRLYDWKQMVSNSHVMRTTAPPAQADHHIHRTHQHARASQGQILWKIFWDIVSRKLYICNLTNIPTGYFGAPIQSGQGFVVFGLSQGDRMVFLVDENPYLQHLDRSFDSIVHFVIGDLQYRWDTENNTLLTQQLGTGPSGSRPEWLDVYLYRNLEEAKAFVNRSLTDDFAMLAQLELESPPPTDSNASSPPDWLNDSYTNFEEAEALVDHSLFAPLEIESPPLMDSNASSPPNAADASSTPAETNLLDLSSTPGFFGLSSSQGEIDRWVDHAVDTDQVARQGAGLQCPEPVCKHVSRRPHALKIHLYTHYGLKPYACRLCNTKCLTPANLDRHVKNVRRRGAGPHN
ncbi:unnamed protein product [Rhizoctonia solani]|uniref:C2H2-type domain-containing protein n=1 Tax=Rhizoctonia solani TaxID=456999 RepID=A0A8H3D1L6_9AGAM|nr:unnamed protein product [Rhizoctonia solani]